VGGQAEPSSLRPTAGRVLLSASAPGGPWGLAVADSGAGTCVPVESCTALPLLSELSPPLLG
jgi:hypothetical protein